jgi:putative endonuclease
LSRSKIEKGKKGELIASRFLSSRGFEIVARNFRIDHKEVDIIAREGEFLVFVEVKFGRLGSFGEPVEWVSPRKKKNLIEAAKLYLSKNEFHNLPVRFDVVAISEVGGKTKIAHFPGAFVEEWTLS